LLSLSRLIPEDAQVLSVDAHYDRLLRPRQHLFDPLVEICLHVPVDTWIALNDGADASERFVVVGVGVDANPALTEVDSDHLFAKQRLPDVRSEARPYARHCFG